MNLVWHRADLRLHDHPALHQALQMGPSLGIVIFDPNILQATSDRRRAWFRANTAALAEAYKQRGGHLLLREGLPWTELPKLVQELRIQKVFAIKSYTPYGKYRDQNVEKQVSVSWHTGQYLKEPGSLTRPDSQAFTVFTPYARAWYKVPDILDIPAPETFPGIFLPEDFPMGTLPDTVSDIGLPPAGEDAAHKALEYFLRQHLYSYHLTRNGLAGPTSRLSHYFNLGVLSPRLAARKAQELGGEGTKKWISELIWRDFSADLLYQRPTLQKQALDPRYDTLPVQENLELFDRWQQGQTGIPIVDGCMRELKATGFLSNRGRMIVAQFLVKLARLPWQWGEKALKDLLLDGDTASNIQGWQWAGGLGLDAAPYLRIYDLVEQGKRHDPEQVWLRKWVPEAENYSTDNAILDLEKARQHYLRVATRLIQS